MKHEGTIFSRKLTLDDVFDTIKADIDADDAAEMKEYGTTVPYHHTILPAIKAVKSKAVAEEIDPQHKKWLEMGHGTFIGRCGHRVAGCRCPEKHPTFHVDVLCVKCGLAAIKKDRSKM